MTLSRSALAPPPVRAATGVPLAKESETGIAGSTIRNPTLDGMRGVAIALVVIWHYFFFVAEFPVGTFASRLSAVTRLFWSGVDLFFVLSGFLIGGILLDARESPRFFRTFYTRRAFRILPLYFAVLLVCALLIWSFGPSGSPISPAYYLTLTQNIYTAITGNFGTGWLAVTWSLAVEEQFYLAAPLLVRVTTRRVLLAIAIMALLVAPLIRLIVFRTMDSGLVATHVLLPTRMDALFFGVGAAILVRSPRAMKTLRANRKLLLIAGLLLAAVVAVFTLTNWNFGTIQLTVAGYSSLALLYGTLLLLAVTDSNGWLSRALRFRPLTALGVRAYGVYLFHFPVLYLVFLAAGYAKPRVSSWDDMLIASVAIVLTIIAASLSWRYFEKPLLRIGQRARY